MSKPNFSKIDLIFYSLIGGGTAFLIDTLPYSFFFNLLIILPFTVLAGIGFYYLKSYIK